MLRQVAAGLLLFAAWQYWRKAQGEVAADGGSMVDSVVESVAGVAVDVWDTVDSAMLRLNNMKTVTPDLLRNGNVQAVLSVIRAGEGTADAGGYSRLYGGGSFSGFADHPRKTVTAGRWTSTAAGAYQFLATTWEETRRIMGLPDFSPASQDLAAVGRIAARGALPDVLAGRLGRALTKIAWEWASMPGSPYGQPTISEASARKIYLAAGGVEVMSA